MDMRINQVSVVAEVAISLLQDLKLVACKELRGWDGEEGQLNFFWVTLSQDAGCRQFVLVLVRSGVNVQEAK
jgi:hypothetical protein